MEVLGDGQVVSGVMVSNNVTKEQREIPATGFFVAIGHKPNTDIFNRFLELDETGYIINVRDPPKRMWKGYLLPEMLQIMCIDKLLRQQVQDVWLL